MTGGWSARVNTILKLHCNSISKQSIIEAQLWSYSKTGMEGLMYAFLNNTPERGQEQSLKNAPRGTLTSGVFMKGNGDIKRVIIRKKG